MILFVGEDVIGLATVQKTRPDRLNRKPTSGLVKVGHRTILS